MTLSYTLVEGYDYDLPKAPTFFHRYCKLLTSVIVILTLIWAASFSVILITLFTPSHKEPCRVTEILENNYMEVKFPNYVSGLVQKAVTINPGDALVDQIIPCRIVDQDDSYLASRVEFGNQLTSFFYDQHHFQVFAALSWGSAFSFMTILWILFGAIVDYKRRKKTNKGVMFAIALKIPLGVLIALGAISTCSEVYYVNNVQTQSCITLSPTASEPNVDVPVVYYNFENKDYVFTSLQQDMNVFFPRNYVTKCFFNYDTRTLSSRVDFNWSPQTFVVSCYIFSLFIVGLLYEISKQYYAQSK